MAYSRPINFQNEPQVLMVLQGLVSPTSNTPLDADNLNEMQDGLAAYSDEVGEGGVELGAVQRTSDFTTTADLASPADVTSMSVTVTVAARPITIEFSIMQAHNSNAGDMSIVHIEEDDTIVASAIYGQHATVSEGVPMMRKVRRTPSAGSHAYKLSASRAAAGTVTLGGSATSPMLLQVIEV